MVFSQFLERCHECGIILTVGMAVDANVLIFERIKEKGLKTEKKQHTHLILVITELKYSRY